ncbi:uncharacterized protein BX663DRAFT_482478 [Cokeromyces recurvatus]|uniref:uncharacterized protein n=1 Tax=Cokeromyces recurvatus TaxID=90255 RepID=UPI002220AA8C|nr:uncharacterized protein BX663DRAFT_482478 [Cokeromyces recurvatus]KAI7908280.1 hypothetical protein BX663DRAFT_482478 [Cokeromyces recurvatus]
MYMYPQPLIIINNNTPIIYLKLKNTIDQLQTYSVQEIYNGKTDFTQETVLNNKDTAIFSSDLQNSNIEDYISSTNNKKTQNDKTSVFDHTKDTILTTSFVKDTNTSNILPQHCSSTIDPPMLEGEEEKDTAIVLTASNHQFHHLKDEIFISSHPSEHNSLNTLVETQASISRNSSGSVTKFDLDTTLLTIPNPSYLTPHTLSTSSTAWRHSLSSLTSSIYMDALSSPVPSIVNNIEETIMEHQQLQHEGPNYIDHFKHNSKHYHHQTNMNNTSHIFEAYKAQLVQIIDDFDDMNRITH